MPEIKVTAKKIERRKKRTKLAKYALLTLLVVVVLIYFILGIIYKGGRFTITLDPNFSLESGITLYESLNNRSKTNKLYASNIDFMDNIALEWIPETVDSESDGGPHNGENYIAYTFYLANEGKEVLNYWQEIYIDDVIKGVDEAVRIVVYQNGDRTVYAKKNHLTKFPEPNTEPFYSDELPVLRGRKDFKPGDIDKYTIIIFIEGNDPDCVNELLGGEIKMHMDIREEHKEQKK